MMGSFGTSRFVRGAVLLVGAFLSACSDEPPAGDTERSPVNSDVDVAADATTTAVDQGSSSGWTSTDSVPISEPPLFDFETSQSSDGWSVVNDTVMGGVSSGQVVLSDGSLIFSGELSLDNNGGFASLRGPSIDPSEAQSWSGRVGPRIEVEGDGRTWTVEVRTDDVSGGWIATLPTFADAITHEVLPWASFEPVTRFLDPRVAEGPLDPRRIVSIAFYLVDGIEGSFRLEILSIS